MNLQQKYESMCYRQLDTQYLAGEIDAQSLNLQEKSVQNFTRQHHFAEVVGQGWDNFTLTSRYQWLIFHDIWGEEWIASTNIIEDQYDPGDCEYGPRLIDYVVSSYDIVEKNPLHLLARIFRAEALPELPTENPKHPIDRYDCANMLASL